MITLPKLKLDPARRRTLAIASMTIAAVLFGDAIYQVVMHVRWRTWVGRYAAAQPATQPSATRPASGPDSAAPPPKLSAAIRKRNIFAPPRPKGHGLALTGVLGHLAFFRTQQNETVTIAEGASDRGITVKSINGYDVTIEYEGKPQTLNLFAGGGPGGGGPGGPPPSMSADFAVHGRVMEARSMSVPAPQAMPSGPNQAIVIEGAPAMKISSPDELPEEIRRQIEMKRESMR